VRFVTSRLSDAAEENLCGIDVGRRSDETARSEVCFDAVALHLRNFLAVRVDQASADVDLVQAAACNLCNSARSDSRSRRSTAVAYVRGTPH
jgi:hypothetical protein